MRFGGTVRGSMEPNYGRKKIYNACSWWLHFPLRYSTLIVPTMVRSSLWSLKLLVYYSCICMWTARKSVERLTALQDYFYRAEKNKYSTRNISLYSFFRLSFHKERNLLEGSNNGYWNFLTSSLDSPVITRVLSFYSMMTIQDKAGLHYGDYRSELQR